MYVINLGTNPAVLDILESDFPSIRRSIEEACTALLELDGNGGPATDGILPALFKSCAYCLTLPLELISKESLQTGIVPAFWKSSLITPVIKAGGKALVTNYTSTTCRQSLSWSLRPSSLNRGNSAYQGHCLIGWFATFLNAPKLFTYDAASSTRLVRSRSYRRIRNSDHYFSIFTYCQRD